MRSRKYSELLKLIKGAESILIVSHVNADVDAVSSAFLLKSLVSKLNSDAQVECLFPSGVSTKARNILEYLNLSYREQINGLPHPTLTFFVDVGSEGVLGEAETLLKEENKKILIDHHLQSSEFLGKFNLSYVEESFSSTCEIIYDVIREVGVETDEKHRYALLSGILVESRFLMNAKCETYSVVRDLCRLGIDFRKALNLLRRVRDFSEKVAILKAFKRMELYKAGDWLFAFIKLSAYRSEAASQIMAVGVDFVAVGSELKDKCKVHVKLSKRFIDTFKMDAGKGLVSIIRDEFGGMGGGHAQVATINVEKDLESVFKFLMNLIARETEEKLGLKLSKLEA